MATETTNYSLTKPEETDYYDVADFNNNMDIIDASMAATATQVGTVGDTLSQIAEYVGTPENEGDTLFSQIGNSEVCIASRNYKYEQNYEDGVAYTYNQVLMRYTARRSGSIYVEIDITSTNSSSGYMYVYANHPGSLLDAPTNSILSEKYVLHISSATYWGASIIASTNLTSNATYTISYMLNVVAGHTYVIIPTLTGTFWGSRIGYDVVNPLELTETDLAPYVETDSEDEVVAELS